MDKTLIRQKIAIAPEDIKGIISSFEVIDLADKIITDNKLDRIMETGKLGQEIVCVLIGVTKINNFINRLNTIGIPPNLTKIISDTVDQKIFSKVRASLEKVQSEETKIPEIHPDKDTILNDIENPTPAVARPIVVNPAGKNAVLDAQHNLPVGEKKVLISSAAVPSRGPMLNNFKTGFGAPAAATTPPVMPKPVPPPAPATSAPMATPTFSQPKPTAPNFTATVPKPKPTPPPPSNLPTRPMPSQPTQMPKPTVQPVQVAPMPAVPRMPTMPPVATAVTPTPKPPQAPATAPRPATPPPPPAAPAPKKYVVDPYREPIE